MRAHRFQVIFDRPLKSPGRLAGRVVGHEKQEGDFLKADRLKEFHPLHHNRRPSLQQLVDGSQGNIALMRSSANRD